jgi:formylglycine-generating enzyme required for sulfatase activity
MLEAAGLWSPMDAAEQPAREIHITKPFFLGKYEVSQAEWKAATPPAAGDNKGAKNAPPANPSTFKGDDRPVETVSADDAAEFIARLNKATATGGRYRLPTEAEWEYAARAGGGDDPFGLGENKTPITPTTLGDYAWFSKNANNTTHPVGTKKANAWGLHDLLGNVWEWCQDEFDPAFYATGPDADPVFKSKSVGSGGVATERILRGGCWFLDARAARVALRGGNLPTFKSQYAGFRLVREL